MRCGQCCSLEVELDWDDDVPDGMFFVTHDGCRFMRREVVGAKCLCVALKGSPLKGYRCSIYDKRPRECREYLCIDYEQHDFLESPLQHLARATGDLYQARQRAIQNEENDGEA